MLGPEPLFDHYSLSDKEALQLWREDFLETKAMILTVPNGLRPIDLLPELVHPSPYIEAAQKPLLALNQTVLTALKEDMQNGLELCERNFSLSSSYATLCGHTAYTFALAVALGTVTEPMTSLSQSYDKEPPKIVETSFSASIRRAQRTEDALSSDLERLFLEAKYKEIYLRARSFTKGALTALFLGAKETTAQQMGRSATAPQLQTEKETIAMLRCYPPPRRDMNLALTLYHATQENIPLLQV